MNPTTFSLQSQYRGLVPRKTQTIRLRPAIKEVRMGADSTPSKTAAESTAKKAFTLGTLVFYWNLMALTAYFFYPPLAQLALIQKLRPVITHYQTLKSPEQQNRFLFFSLSDEVPHLRQWAAREVQKLPDDHAKARLILRGLEGTDPAVVKIMMDEVIPTVKDARLRALLNQLATRRPKQTIDLTDKKRLDEYTGVRIKLQNLLFPDGETKN